MLQALVVATVGRPELVAKLLDQVSRASPPPDEVVLSPVGELDLPDLSETSYPFKVTVIIGARGAAAQRNAGVDAVSLSPDVIVFMDDDSMPRSDFFEQVSRHFEERQESQAMTGNVILEGSDRAVAPLTEDEIQGALRSSFSNPLTLRPDREHDQLYGCNMAIRSQVFSKLRFDERLPLYSYLEDLDMARGIIQGGGKIFSVPSAVIVHRMDPSGGRRAARRFGYSSVMNWEYLRRKGRVPVTALRYPIFVTLKNILLSAVGDQRQLRRGRLRGNALAFADLARGRVTPERIEQL